MKILDFIINLLISPFTFVFRIKSNQGIRKEVKYIWVLLLSVVVVAVFILLFYYKDLFKK